MTNTAHLELQACLSPWETMRQSYQTKIAELEPISSAYENNLKRVYLFTIFPAALVNATKTLTEIAFSVRAQHLKNLKAGKIGEPFITAEIQAAIDKDANLREMIIRGGGDAAQDLLQREIGLGFRAMNEFLSGELADAGYAWLAAQITGTWTAFEAMTEELWTAALNAHPAGLAELSAGKKMGGDKKIDFKYFGIHGYDLSSKMGFVLRERYSFDRLEGIRNAYTDAWFENDETILDTINDRSLDALAETRHVIIHNGGLVDKKYLSKKSYLPPELVVPVHTPLPLDGNVTALLTSRVMIQGWSLIMAVDKWLDERQQQK